MHIKRLLAGFTASLVLALGVPLAAVAATVPVTPSSTGDWSTASTTAGGSVGYVEDTDAPIGEGALQLTTNATTAAKAQYMHQATVPIAEITDLSYASKQNSASFAGGNASYQMEVFLNGEAGGYTTLVFEPYQNGTVTPDTWQTWDVDAGQFWSTRTVTCSSTGAVITAGGGGAPFYTLEQIEAACPDAVVLSYGVNIGSNNPSYDILVDALVFNGTTYDFGPAVSVSSKDACKNDGWRTSNTPVYKNQGDCVSSFASKKKAAELPAPTVVPNF